MYFAFLFIELMVYNNLWYFKYYQNMWLTNIYKNVLASPEISNNNLLKCNNYLEKTNNGVRNVHCFEIVTLQRKLIVKQEA